MGRQSRKKRERRAEEEYCASLEQDTFLKHDFMYWDDGHFEQVLDGLEERHFCEGLRARQQHGPIILEAQKSFFEEVTELCRKLAGEGEGGVDYRIVDGRGNVLYRESLEQKKQ